MMTSIFLFGVEASFMDWIFNNFPALGGLVFVLWLIWQVAWRISNYYNRLVKVEVDSADVKQWRTSVDSRFTGIDRRLDGIDRRLDQVDHKLDKLIAVLSTNGVVNHDVVKALSPIELTEIGSRILVDMGGKTYIDVNLPVFIKQMETQAFKSGLDVQTYCTSLLFDKTSDDDFLLIKNYIFANPSYKINDTESKPLNLMMAIAIMGIYLRNKYFEKHPALYCK